MNSIRRASYACCLIGESGKYRLSLRIAGLYACTYNFRELSRTLTSVFEGLGWGTETFLCFKPNVKIYKMYIKVKHHPLVFEFIWSYNYSCYAKCFTSNVFLHKTKNLLLCKHTNIFYNKMLSCQINNLML